MCVCGGGGPHLFLFQKQTSSLHIDKHQENEIHSLNDTHTNMPDVINVKFDKVHPINQ